MNEFEVIKTVLTFNRFDPPEGVEFVVFLRPSPGVCKVGISLRLRADHDTRQDYLLSEPPSEPAMRALYLAAQEMIDVPSVRRAVHAIALSDIVGLDVELIGEDQ